ncbi:unnamed protein product [Allacma fusca]|uniref:Uncharacterized protein n=1 Tax=Allacma fusca TaxID=39272 RepID=A0A8J2NXP6_9HEXA|nr:unnamed protein product [Allacma fusca]
MDCTISLRVHPKELARSEIYQCTKNQCFSVNLLCWKFKLKKIQRHLHFALDVIVAELTNDPACNCSLPNTQYESSPESNSGNYKTLGVCASSGYSFLDACWLDAYNEIFNQSVTTAPDSDYRNSETLLNHCLLSSEQCLHGVQVLHCGPCGINCSQIVRRADCLVPSSSIKCIVNPQPPTAPNAEPCATDCNNNTPPAITCTYDLVRQNFLTFNNPCIVNCTVLFRLHQLEKLYGNEGLGGCSCV